MVNVMDEIRLIKPTADYAEDIWDFRREFLENDPSEDMGGSGKLRECSCAEEWIKLCDNLSDSEACPGDWVQADTYIAVRQSDNKIVGIIDLRHHINHPILGEWGGHIGYCVRPDERRKGYAKEMLRLNLENCRRLGLEKVMISCHAGNIASERTILTNGGFFERLTNDDDGRAVKRYWITL